MCPENNVKAEIGLWGLAVMGENLALNIESRGRTVAVFNRTLEKVDDFVNDRAKNKKIIPTYSVEEFVNSLAKPKKIIIMVKAGQPVDLVINQLEPLLEKGDLIIDGGNSYFLDTIRRANTLEEKGLFFLGTGISGGEEGALKGPSLMPGGSKAAYDLVDSLFQEISAKVDGQPCCSYIGDNGAGHFVKTVHNAIEYGDMQLISEAYYLMKNALCLSSTHMHEVFSQWNQGELNSFLIEITSDILSRKDPQKGRPLVEMVLDKAGQKGTGAWAGKTSLQLGAAVPTLVEAVFARSISALQAERKIAAKLLKGPGRKLEGDKESFLEALHDALFASKICTYAQGFALMSAAAKEYNWKLKLGEIAMIWRGGCIIRAQFLDSIKQAYDRDGQLANLMLDSNFKEILQKSQPSWRKVVIEATKLGIPVPAFSSALSYFDSYRTEHLSANMIQAQRDYFGAHTYQRIDAEGNFHTDWRSLPKL
ncbi:MAG: NADP-dependent phosphogluconate dehydrogenase [Planctomycetota bacterium]|jgi:6-phosphogluconate dehydrogenase